MATRRSPARPLAAATRLECYSARPTHEHASAAAGKTAASSATTCEAARGIFGSELMSSFDPRGGVLQLHEDGTETELASWLLAHVVIGAAPDERLASPSQRTVLCGRLLSRDIT